MTMSGTHTLVGLGIVLGFGSLVRSGDREVDPVLGIAGFGVVLGALLPDVDFILTTVLYFYDTKLANLMHRTFTHSLVTLLIVLLTGVTLTRGNQKRRAFAVGIAVGIGSHILLDLLFWFDEVAIFWPLHAISDVIPFWVALYGEYTPPDLFTKLVFAWEYGSLALYVAVLSVLSDRLGTNEEYRSRLRLWFGVYLLAFLGSLALIPVFELATYQVVVFAPSAPFFWPLAVWITVQMRETLEKLSQHGASGALQMAQQSGSGPAGN